MAIVCPKCGRQYDITLFQFGKTIKCDCGNTVRIKIKKLREFKKRGWIDKKGEGL